MLAAVPDSEGSPPLYYVLAWVWSEVFGTSEWGVRSFTVLVGVATIPVVFLIGRRLGGVRAGLVLALLAAVSPQLVWHAQDARSYALVVLLSACSVLAFLRAAERPAAGRLAVWAAVSALAMATHYFAGFLIAVEVVWLLARGAPVARRRTLVACAAVGVAALALVPLAVAQSGHAGAFLSGLPLGRRVAQAGVESVVGYQPPAELLVAALGALLVAVVAWIFVRCTPQGERRRLALPLALGAAVVAVPLLAAPLGNDWFTTRNLVAAWPPLAAVAAVVLTSRGAGRAGVAVVAAYAVLSVVVVVTTADEPKFEHDDWRTAFRAAGAADGPRAFVVNPENGHVPLEVYRPATEVVRRGDVVVREVAVVLLPSPYRRVGRTPVPPREPVAAPSGGFVQAERREAPTFTLVRFRAPRPVRVPVSALEAMSDRPTRASSVAVER